MAKVLNARSVSAIRPDPTRRIEVPDAAFPGLYLVVQPSGVRSWAYRYRADGRTRKLTIGRFPALSLAKAREEAGRAAQDIELGEDPAAVKAAKKTAEREDATAERNTVNVLVEQFAKRHLSQIKSGTHARQFLDRFVVKEWGARDIHEITKRDVLDLLDSIVDAGTPTTANRVFAHTRKFLNWCVERDILERSPAEGVKPPAKEVSRDRVLSDDEIRWLWRAADAEGQPFGPLVKVLLLTGQRLGEVVGMSDHEIEDDIWHLSPIRTKNKRAHSLPLSPAVRDVLDSVVRIESSGGLIFTTNGETPVSGYDRAIKRLRTAVEAIAEEERGAPVNVPIWTFHDLRRTAATGMARLGYPVQVVEAVLNHKSGSVSGIAAVYNRHDYASEKREALEAWATSTLSIGARAGGTK